MPPVGDGGVASACPLAPGPVAIVTGRANSASLSVQTVSDTLEQAARDGESVTVIDAGGEPSIKETVVFSTSAANDVAANDQLRAAAARLAQGVAGVVPSAAEANPLAGLAWPLGKSTGGPSVARSFWPIPDCRRPRRLTIGARHSSAPNRNRSPMRSNVTANCPT